MSLLWGAAQVRGVLEGPRRNQARDLRGMQGELAKRHRLWMRLPCELTRRHSLEYAPGGLPFLIDFLYERVAHSHTAPPLSIPIRRTLECYDFPFRRSRAVV